MPFRTGEWPFLATNDPIAQQGRAQVERKRRTQEHSLDHVSKTKPETLNYSCANCTKGTYKTTG